MRMFTRVNTASLCIEVTWIGGDRLGATGTFLAELAREEGQAEGVDEGDGDGPDDPDDEDGSGL